MSLTPRSRFITDAARSPRVAARETTMASPTLLATLSPKMLIEKPTPTEAEQLGADKQKRKAEHIEEGYEDRGVSKDEAERRAWATVNKESGGGNKSGSGRGKKDTNGSSKKGGRKGGSSQSSEDRSKAAKKGWETRRKQGKG